MVSLKVPNAAYAGTCKVKTTVRVALAGIVLPFASHDNNGKVTLNGVRRVMLAGATMWHGDEECDKYIGKLTFSGEGGYVTRRYKGPVAAPMLVNTRVSV